MANFALSTAFIANDSLSIHVYPGKNASFTLYEDDGVSEAYRKNEKRTTEITFNQTSFSLKIDAAAGTYKNACEERAYQIVFHGISKPVFFKVNGVKIKMVQAKQNQTSEKDAAVWDEHKKILTVSIQRSPVTKAFVIKQI
jgi:alpha-D-xyloside xylohydrolase